MLVFALFLLCATPVPDGGAVVELPAVDVPMPQAAAEPLPTAPQVRDPAAALSTQDGQSARAEAKDAAALLNAVPGATVQDSGGVGQRKTLSLRGAAPNAVMVLLDGVPLTAPGAAMDLSRIPIAALQRIDVLRGGGSARYGPGAMGGVVNLVTKSPGEQVSLFADATQGSFVTTQLSAGATAPVLGGEGLLLVHGLRSEGTFDFRFDPQPSIPNNELITLRRVNNGSLQGGGLFRFRKKFSGTQVDVIGEGSAEQRGLAGPVQNPSASASQSTGRGLLAARSITSFDAGGSLATLGWGRVDATSLNGTFFGAGTYRQQEVSSGLEAVYSQLLGRHGLTGLVSGGGDWLFAPGSARASWGRFSTMLADEMLWLDGALALHASVRVDVAGPFTVFSPKAGVVVELPKHFSIRANAGQASRPPTFTELYVVQGTLLPNAELRPERALAFDLGGGWANERFKLAATAFLSRYEDLISYEYYPPNLARPYNFQAAEVMGVEIEASAHVASWLEGQLSYAYTHSQNQRDDPRYYLKSLPFRPTHRAHLRIVGGVDFLKGRAELMFQSAQFTNRTETLSFPARAMLNLGLTAQPWKQPQVSISAELKNVLDVQAQDIDGYPLPPRAFFVTAGFHWEQPAPSSRRDAGGLSQDAVTQRRQMK